MKHTLIGAALLASTAATAHANLVVNPSFETGDFTGWNEVGDTFFNFVTDELAAGGPTDGTYHAAFGATDPGGGGLLQSIATTPGGDYTLSFDLANLGAPPNAFGLFWDGAFVDIFFDLDPFEYVSVALTLTASSGTTDLGFIFYNLPEFFLLDNISLEAADVPAPATMALFGLGALALAGARRRG